MHRTFTAVIALAFACAFSQHSQAGLIVYGQEIAAGEYRLTFDQSGPADAVQTPLLAFLGVNFRVNSTDMSTLFNSPTGNISDGSTILNASGTAWVGANGLSFDPNGIAVGSSVTFKSNNAGVDFSTQVVRWEFSSAQLLSGRILQGSAPPPPPVPEPASLAVFLGMMGASLGIRRRKA